MSKFMGVDDAKIMNIAPTGHLPLDLRRPMSPTDVVLQMKGQRDMVSGEARLALTRSWRIMK
jgi:hypothetical protein